MAAATSNDDGAVVVLGVTEGMVMTPAEARGFAEALQVAAEHADRTTKENARRARAVAEAKEVSHDLCPFVIARGARLALVVVAG